MSSFNAVLELNGKLIEALSKEDEDILKDKFGTAYNWAITGFILPDGSRLDLSGVKLGANGYSRSIDHREVAVELSKYSNLERSDALVEMMADGVIRVIPEVPGLDMIVEPTEEQYNAIGKFVQWARKEGGCVVDFSNRSGYVDKSNEYDEFGCSVSRIVGDIAKHFGKE